ncbi:tetratricopeptide repeat protein [Allorhodopirellula heiligendammensis]|uniref:Lipoprotein NlpI n=1 Tax=Allorhodopirellula heiligendammensis TaxID=2714739 RepID=A0A5C6C792_9BACT|nr:tetratricopeptide repeat protein [Allorhodopirellula heiligendammensis]TWU20028.1 lipoprotein NlpI [Allorhodopirellula heiligendammensis]
MVRLIATAGPAWASKSAARLARIGTGCVLVAVLFAAPRGHAASPGQPVVAKVEMKLQGEAKAVELIARGDLLTVIEDRGDDYVIVTQHGIRGAVGKANVAELADSTDIYTELIEKFPQQGRYDTLRASAWWARGEHDRALADFNSAIDKGFQAAQAYSSRGLFLAAQGDHQGALADYDRALAIDPADVTPLVNRAEINMQQGEFDKAIADYTAALKTRPDNAALLRQRAIASKAAGKLEQAISDLDAIIAANAEDAQAVMDRGYIRFQQGQYAAAAADFSIAIKLNDQDSVAWNNRGYNLYQLGKGAEALHDFDRAIELAPNYALAHQNRAWLLSTSDDPSLRDPEAAVTAAKRACDINAYKNISDLSALAAAYAAAGRFQEAIQWQEKVVELAPEDVKAVAKSLLSRYRDQQPFIKQNPADKNGSGQREGGEIQPR